MPEQSNQSRKTLILTGASRGIGHATVKRFSSAGWRVITCSRQPFPEDCPWEMGPEDHIQVDLADPADTERAIVEMKQRLVANDSRLNALVNNAALSPKGPNGERLGSIDTNISDWQWVFQVNFFAPIMLARGLLSELESAQGAVVNVSSIVGSRVHPFAGAAYATSKAALASLTREMAHEFGQRGVRVNARPIADAAQLRQGATIRYKDCLFTNNGMLRTSNAPDALATVVSARSRLRVFVLVCALVAPPR